MKKTNDFERGMGIEGWLTNYKRFNVLLKDKRLHITIGDMEHFATYITESDFNNDTRTIFSEEMAKIIRGKF